MKSNAAKSYPNRLGLKGWAYAGRYGLERYLYLGHRLSGLGLIAYMVLHIIETANRMRGEEAWAGLMGLFASPPFKVIEPAPSPPLLAVSFARKIVPLLMTVPPA